MAYRNRMARTPKTLSEFEGPFWCYEWQNASRSPSVSIYRPCFNSHTASCLAKNSLRKTERHNRSSFGCRKVT